MHRAPQRHGQLFPNLPFPQLVFSLLLAESITHTSHSAPPTPLPTLPLDKLILPPPLQLSTRAPEPTELASSPPLTEGAKPTPRAHPTTRRITTARPATTPWMTHGAAKTTVRPLATSPVVLATTQPAYVESGSAEGSGDQEMGTSGDQEASGAGSAGERPLRLSGAQHPGGLTDLGVLKVLLRALQGKRSWKKAR